MTFPHWDIELIIDQETEDWDADAFRRFHTDLLGLINSAGRPLDTGHLNALSVRSLTVPAPSASAALDLLLKTLARYFGAHPDVDLFRKAAIRPANLEPTEQSTLAWQTSPWVPRDTTVGTAHEGPWRCEVLLSTHMDALTDADWDSLHNDLEELGFAAGRCSGADPRAIAYVTLDNHYPHKAAAGAYDTVLAAALKVDPKVTVDGMLVTPQTEDGSSPWDHSPQ